MPLRFRIEITKKSGPRIAVIRETPQEDGSLKTEQIGSFSARKKPEALLPKLENDIERHEFHSYLSQLKFNKNHFGSEADKLDRMIIRIDTNAKKKMLELALACDEHNIPFMPEDCMLNSLLKRAAAAEAKLNHKLGKNVFLLESLGITIPNITPPQQTDNWLTLPFQLLLKLKSPDEICNDFINLARKYHKTTHFKPGYFQYYAGMSADENKNKPSKWYYGIAIELLNDYHCDPIKQIPPEKVAEYWGWLQKEKLSIDETIKAFIKKFIINQYDIDKVTLGIHKAYGLVND
ncbi:hypothetical protein BH10PSE19_BH10PSE19_09990 [soil metagenome]